MKKEYIAPSVIFLSFFCFLLMQFANVGVYFDDYGYYSLNYGAETIHIGTDYTFKELINYLKEHYVGANGRLLSFFLWLSIYKIGGLEAVRIVDAAVITLIFAGLYRILVYKKEHRKAELIFLGLILCGCYGLIDIEVHKWGTYWLVAFAIYYVLMIPFILFIILYGKYKNELSGRRLALLSLLVFWTGWSVESWSIAVVMLMLTLNIKVVLEKKKVCYKHIILFGISIVPVLILFLSPGIQRRAGNSVDIGEGIVTYFANNVNVVFRNFFGTYSYTYVVFLLTSILLITFINYLKKTQIRSFILLIFVSVIYIAYLNDNTIFYELTFDGIKSFVLIILIVFVMMIPIIEYFLEKKDESQSLLLLTAFYSMICLAGISEIQLRVFIPFILCSFLIIANAFIDLWRYARQNKEMRVVAVSLVAVYIIVVSHNIFSVYKGYEENAEVCIQNDEILKEAKKRIDNGECVEEIRLKKLVDDRFGACMLYQEGFGWFEADIEYYYGLPNEVVLIYE